MARFLVLCALPLLILAACSESDRPATVTDNVTQTVTESVDTSAEVPLVVDVSSIVAAPVPLPAVVDPDPTPVALRPVPDSLPDIDPRAVDFIVREEVISSAYYTRKLQRPICPACRTTPSGPTVGIGSDLGHLSHAGVDEFWVEHPQRERLHTGVGFTGKAAIPVTATLQDVLTPYDLAYRVFAHKQLIAFYYSCRRAFGPKNWSEITPSVWPARSRAVTISQSPERETRTMRAFRSRSMVWPRMRLSGVDRSGVRSVVRKAVSRMETTLPSETMRSVAGGSYWKRSLPGRCM